MKQIILMQSEMGFLMRDKSRGEQYEKVKTVSIFGSFYISIYGM